VRAILPDGTQLEGTPEELSHFITKPIPFQLVPQVIPNPMPYTPSEPYP
jgi:hypothetical protein